MQAQKGADYTEIVGRDFYRSDNVNEGHYSKKRADVADVDPKVSAKFDAFQAGLTVFIVLCIGHGAFPADPRQASPQGRH